MSKIEEIAYEAEKLGVRTELFSLVSYFRTREPYKPLDETYELAMETLKERLKNANS